MTNTGGGSTKGDNHEASSISCTSPILIASYFPSTKINFTLNGWISLVFNTQKL